MISGNDLILYIKQLAAKYKWSRERVLDAAKRARAVRLLVFIIVGPAFLTYNLPPLAAANVFVTLAQIPDEIKYCLNILVIAALLISSLAADYYLMREKKDSKKSAAFSKIATILEDHNGRSYQKCHTILFNNCGHYDSIEEYFYDTLLLTYREPLLSPDVIREILEVP